MVTSGRVPAHTYIHTCAHSACPHSHAHTCMHTFTHTHIHLCTSTRHLPACTHMCTRTCNSYVPSLARMHVFKQHTHACPHTLLHKRMCTHVHISQQCENAAGVTWIILLLFKIASGESGNSFLSIYISSWYGPISPEFMDQSRI